MTSILGKAKGRIRRISNREPSPYPNWQRLLVKDRASWQAALKAAEGGPKVLIATSIGGHLPVVTLNSLLAVALTLRGAEAHILLCDGFLPACEFLTIHTTPDLKGFSQNGVSRSICHTCFPGADEMYRSLKIPVHHFSDFVIPEEVEASKGISAAIPLNEIKDYCLDGLKVGEHALAGALRFYGRGDINSESAAEPILRHYLQSALLTVFGSRRIIRQYRFASSTFHHGIYVPQGLLGEVARQEGLPVTNWQVAYRKKSFIFSHNDTYHHTLMEEPTKNWENIEWAPQVEADLMAYLKSRWQGTRDWIWFHESPKENLEEIVREVGVDLSKPIIGMLTNVFWDAQLHYPANAFKDMREWTMETIHYFNRRPDLQLVIRIHPAEIRGTVKSRQLMAEEIRQEFPVLPDNVFVIPPESHVSTYAIMSLCNAVIIYGTKTGVELTSMGIPVIVGGEAWIRNKGLTLDASTAKEYFGILDRLPFESGMDQETIDRARKYAFHFFFRRMIPVESIEPSEGWPPYDIRLSGLNELLPGKDPGLDIICDGILHRTDFIYPAEKYVDHR